MFITHKKGLKHDGLFRKVRETRGSTTLDLYYSSAWQVLEAEITRSGLRLRRPNDTPGYVKTCFVEVPHLGHMLEFILPREGLMEKMNVTPVA